MYKTATNNLNYAYDFGAVYKLILRNGKRKERVLSKRVTSAWRLSNKEIKLIGDVWRDEAVENFGKQFDNPHIKLDYFEVEWCVVDRSGNSLGLEEN